MIPGHALQEGKPHPDWQVGMPSSAARRRADCGVTRAATVLGEGRGHGRTGQFSPRPGWDGLRTTGMALAT